MLEIAVDAAGTALSPYTDAAKHASVDITQFFSRSGTGTGLFFYTPVPAVNRVDFHLTLMLTVV